MARNNELTVCVGNLSHQTIPGDFDDLFKGLAIDNVHQVRDRETGRFKGTAFVTFKDNQSLDAALQKDGITLMDRELRISMANNRKGGSSRGRGNGSYGGNRNSDRNNYNSNRSAPSNEMPTQPPYTAFVGNLKFSVVESDLEAFFDGLNFTGVRVIRHPDTNDSKGHAYVDFGDRESLEQALTANDADLQGRPIRIDIATQKRNSGHRSFSSGGGGGGIGRDSNYSPRSTEFAIPTAETEKERKKLVLKPRTVPKDSASMSTATSVKKTINKDDPFGGAAPRDEKAFQEKMNALKEKSSTKESK